MEGIFSLFIVFLVLGSLVFTLQQAGAVKGNTKNLDKLGEVFHTFMLIKADIRANLEVLNTSGTSSELNLTRVSPDRPFLARIGPAQDEDPFKPADQIRVRYYLDSGVLRRRITQPDDSFTAERLLKVSNFSVDRSDIPPVIQIDIEIENTRVNKTHSMKVALR